MNVRPSRQVLFDHRRALDVPAGATRPPWALPGGLAGLRRFPEREVQRVLFITGYALLGLAHLFGALLAELTVGWVAFYTIVDVAVAGGVGVTLLDEFFDQRDHLGYVPGGAGFNVRERNSKHLQPLVEGVRVAAHDLLPVDAFCIGLVDDLVLYVRDILYETNFVASAPQVSYNYVPKKGSAGVADVDVVVDGRTANVDPDLAVLPDLYHTTA